jgi:hypothetical protein
MVSRVETLECPFYRVIDRAAGLSGAGLDFEGRKETAKEIGRKQLLGKNNTFGL